jgi:hypothetical protein
MILGENLVQIVLHDDGKFYKERDKERTTPLDVAPIPKGLTIMTLCHYNRDYGPTQKEEYNYELGNLVSRLGINEKDVLSGQIAVRREGYTDTFPVEFYRLMNQNSK